MKVTLNEIKAFLEAEMIEFFYIGDASLEISNVSAITEPAANSITWIKHLNDFDLLSIDHHLNLLIVVNELPTGPETANYNIIVAADPKAVYFEILNKFFKLSEPVASIAPSAIVETKNIGSNVSIGHHCYLCDDVMIGNNVVIKNNVVIECPTTIGDDCIIESGTIIGTPGYGYYTDHNNQIKKVPDFGGVVIGNRVDIGANVCIARGTLSNTVIEDDVKIDNLCHIAHNARIGARSYIIALSMLGGSCKLAEDAYIAPGAMIMNQINVGKNTLVGMGAAVTKNIDANKVVAGVPAKVIRDRFSSIL